MDPWIALRLIGDFQLLRARHRPCGIDVYPSTNSLHPCYCISFGCPKLYLPLALLKLNSEICGGGEIITYHNICASVDYLCLAINQSN